MSYNPTTLDGLDYNYDTESIFLDGTKFKLITDTDWNNPPRLYDWDGNEYGKLVDGKTYWEPVTDDNSSFFNTFGSDLNVFVDGEIGDNQNGKDNVESKKNEDATNAKSAESDGSNTEGAKSPKWTVTGIKDPEQGTLAGETAFAIEPTLIYPQDHASDEYDFIKIIPIEYVPALSAASLNRTNRESLNRNNQNTTIDPNSSSWFGFKDVKQRYMRTKRVGSTVFLPMTPDIGEQNSVDWGGKELNPIQAAGARLAMNAMTTAGAGRPGEALGNLFGETAAAAQAFVNNPQASAFVKAYFAGRAVNANLLGRAGIVINPNLEVLFNGPRLRTFTYNFKFTPRGRQEARTVRKIIKLFKKTMAVKRRDKIFLSVPAVYKIQYIFNTGFRDHPFLNKIKPCALSGFNVSYAPDGTYMTYKDGSMTSYNIQMKFDELEPIYNDDIDDVDDPTTGF